MEIRKFVTTCEDIQAELGEPTGRIVRKAVCSAVITNPLVGKRHKDLTMLELMGAEISGMLAERALVALGVEAGEVTAYGKAAIVGTAGEIEHAAALIHPRFGAPVRKVVVQGLGQNGFNRFSTRIYRATGIQQTYQHGLAFPGYQRQKFTPQVGVL